MLWNSVVDKPLLFASWRRLRLDPLLVHGQGEELYNSFYSPLGDVCGWTIEWSEYDDWVLFLFVSWRRLRLDRQCRTPVLPLHLPRFYSPLGDVCGWTMTALVTVLAACVSIRLLATVCGWTFRMMTSKLRAQPVSIRLLATPAVGLFRGDEADDGDADFYSPLGDACGWTDDCSVSLVDS